MHSFTSVLVVLAATLGCVNALPASHFPKFTGCNVCRDVIPLPSNQTVMSSPPDAEPVYIGAGVGTQNYSCSDAGTYVSIGAVAELFDASCVYNAVSKANSVSSARSALGKSSFVLGHHYFINNPVAGGTGLSPKFDFTSDSKKGDPNAFVVTAKKANIPSPSGSAHNVDWLELTAIPGQGSLAKYVYRINTVGGQPPNSCKPGSKPIAVPYAALYWFFN